MSRPKRSTDLTNVGFQIERDDLASFHARIPEGQSKSNALRDALRQYDPAPAAPAHHMLVNMLRGVLTAVCPKAKVRQLVTGGDETILMISSSTNAVDVAVTEQTHAVPKILVGGVPVKVKDFPGAVLSSLGLKTAPWVQ